MMCETQYRTVWNHEDLDSMEETCSLDIADRGPATLLTIGNAMGVTKEAARQQIVWALKAARRKSKPVKDFKQEGTE